jgi:hypothetical protein
LEKETLVIIDDIADSFDYKNKFAIIEFLKDISKENKLKLIILTHNFDFYRTVQSRILDEGKWTNSYVAQKNEAETLLLNGGSKNVSNPFELWKEKCWGEENSAMLISMIPFVRNLIQYKDGEDSEHYLILTSMLHIKEKTSALTIKDLSDAIFTVLKKPKNNQLVDDSKKIIDLIYETADAICKNAKNDEICLENKIVLSIAARLKAEQFMLSKIKIDSAIKKNQTTFLFEEIKKNDKGNILKKEKQILSQVILMTPENIHLNSFMYEPLMDMSVLHLVDLYIKLKNMYISIHI